MRITMRWMVLAGALGCGDAVDVAPPAPQVNDSQSHDATAAAVEEHIGFGGHPELPVRYLQNVAPGPVYHVDAPSFDHVDFHVSLGAAEFRVLDRFGAPILNWTSTDAYMGEINEPVANEGFVVLPRPGARLEFRGLNPIQFARFEFGQGTQPVSHDLVETQGEVFEFYAAIAGRWIPPADVLAIANAQYLPYTGAPSSCSGNFKPGTREIAEFLKREFPGAASYGGYSCRANTANTSQLSVHASGRAIDLMVPVYGNDADNDKGDPIAHYLITNAQALGIEFIVWDKTSWGAHREAPKHRQYTGPIPHIDHLHIEVSPSSAALTGRTFPSINRDQAPVGYLDSANCDAIAGWSQDPDVADRDVPVHIYIGGPAGSPNAVGYNIKAKNRREDLCAAIGSCDHGFVFPTPRGFLDGQPHEVYAYGIDISGGQNAMLVGGPKTIQCDRPTLPFSTDYGVKRHVTNPESMAAWGFDFSDVAVLDDAVLAELPEGLPLPAVPTLAVVEGEPAVYLVEPGVKRHVPNPTVMDTWKFDWATIETRTDLEAHLNGVPVTDRPFLARGTDGRVFLVEPPPSLWADQLRWEAPVELGRGQEAQLNLQARNRGSAEWTPGDFRLVPSPSVRCTNCDEALDTTVAPEGRTTLSVTIVAPDAVGPHRMCFALEAAGSLFSAVGQGGPAEEQCLTVNVVDNPVDLPAANVPGTRPSLANMDSVSTERGCSSAAGAPGILGLFVFGLLRRRR